MIPRPQKFPSTSSLCQNLFYSFPRDIPAAACHWNFSLCLLLCLRLSLRKALSVHRLLSGFHLDPLSPRCSRFTLCSLCWGFARENNAIGLNTEETEKCESIDETFTGKTAWPPRLVEVDSNFAERSECLPIRETREDTWQSLSQVAPGTSAA